MTTARKAHLKARIKEAGIDAVLEAISAVGESSFCCGSSGAWQADFDFVLQPKSFARLLEGKYRDRPKPREKFKNGALEILAREAEQRWRDPPNVIDAEPPALQHVSLLGFGDD